MPGVPTPIRVALGLAATAAEEARKLPETLPSAVSGVPMIAVSTAMQASLKMQQRLASLAAKGDQVLALLRPPSDEPPSWATFDETPEPAASGAPQRAAFDRVDYEHPSPAEAADELDESHLNAADADGAAPADIRTAAPPAKKSAPRKAASHKQAPGKQAPRKPASREPAPPKPTPPKPTPQASADKTTATERPAE